MIPEKLGLLHYRSITESFGRSDWREVLRNDGGKQVRSGLGLYSEGFLLEQMLLLLTSYIPLLRS